MEPRELPDLVKQENVAFIYLLDKETNINSPVNIDIIKDNSKISYKNFLNKLLAHYCQMATSEIKIEKAKYGKPYLTGKKKIWFNVSHSNNAIVILLSSTSEVGIDVEYFNPKRDYQKIAKRFFHSKEIDKINSLSNFDANKTSHQLWCLKESYIKAIGKGLYHPLNKFYFKLNTGNTTTLLDDSPEFSNDNFWTCEFRSINENYGFAFCIKKGSAITQYSLNDNKIIS
ncbi:4'-phosphopantetheinyl transferase superfamily protein [Vibrio splendidus]